MWGCNDKKQLGLSLELTEGSGTDEVNSHGERSGAGSSTTINQDVKVPHQLEPCPFEQHDDGQVPEQIVAGYNYSSAVATDGIVYTWGNGEFGRLGYLDVLRQPVPRQMTDLKDHRITKLALGYYHAAAIDE